MKSIIDILKMISLILMFGVLVTGAEAMTSEIPQESTEYSNEFNVVPPDENPPLIQGTRVPYYYRYTVRDSNGKDWDYVYVFRLGTTSYPNYYRHWYRPWGWCWPTYLWIWGSQWRNPYFKDGSWYFEFLFDKFRVDALTCYGYIELEYWY